MARSSHRKATRTRPSQPLEAMLASTEDASRTPERMHMVPQQRDPEAGFETSQEMLHARSSLTRSSGSPCPWTLDDAVMSDSRVSVGRQQRECCADRWKSERRPAVFLAIDSKRRAEPRSPLDAIACASRPEPPPPGGARTQSLTWFFSIIGVLVAFALVGSFPRTSSLASSEPGHRSLARRHARTRLCTAGGAALSPVI